MVDDAWGVGHAPGHLAPIGAGRYRQVDDGEVVVGSARATDGLEICECPFEQADGEGKDRHGEATPSIETRNEFRSVDQHDKTAGRAGHDAFPNECPARAFNDQAVSGHRIRTVEGNVDRARQASNLDAARTRESIARTRGRNPANSNAASDPFTERANRCRGRAAGAKTDDHPVFDQGRRGPACGAPSVVASCIGGHRPESYARLRRVEALTDDLRLIDTRLGGVGGVTGVLVALDDRPALLDVGAQTSVAEVRSNLDQLGIGPADLAWIVLTHIHLDHCGGTGDLAAAYPNAQVVVHPRGVRHLADPTRLVDASARVYGPLASMYGGLHPTDPERILAAEHEHRVALGPGRDLVMLNAPGHARHQMAILHEPSGTMLVGDALGARLSGAGLHPMTPPSEFDPDAALATLALLQSVASERIVVSHFGELPSPSDGLDLARAQIALIAATGRRSWEEERRPEAVAAAVRAALPSDEACATPDARRIWDWLGWEQANIDGIIDWLARADR